MSFRVSGKLSFRKFQNCVPLVVQLERLANLAENANAVVADLPAPLKNKGQGFLLNYFEAVAVAVAARGVLEGKTAMIRLGKTRDNLKHHGVRPLSRDVEALRAGAANFFVSNVPLIFGVEFDRISMARQTAPISGRRWTSLDVVINGG